MSILRPSIGLKSPALCCALMTASATLFLNIVLLFSFINICQLRKLMEFIHGLKLQNNLLVTSTIIILKFNF